MHIGQFIRMRWWTHEKPTVTLSENDNQLRYSLAWCQYGIAYYSGHMVKMVSQNPMLSRVTERPGTCTVRSGHQFVEYRCYSLSPPFHLCSHTLIIPCAGSELGELLMHCECLEGTINDQCGLNTEDSCAGFEKAIKGCKTRGGRARSEKP